MRPRVGVSQCLLGEGVRPEGGHKLDPVVKDVLGPLVEYVPVCPEVEVGMGVPRERIHLEAVGRSVALLGNESRTDHTAAMESWAKARVEALRALGLSGYILKSRSPSCGLENVPILDRQGAPVRAGSGLFAKALLEGYEGLPIIEEASLHDERLREEFMKRVFSFNLSRGSGS